MQAAVLTAANTTSTLVWMAITTTWSRTGISAIYQDYKAAIWIRVGMSNLAKDVTCLQTHFERLSVNNAPVSAYKQGMILLSAIPNEWDHVATYYVQTCTSVANMLFDTIRKAILAKFNRSSGSHLDQTHVTVKISAIKQKGKPPHFFKQKGADSSSATNNAGPSSSKKRHERKNGKKPQGNSHHCWNNRLMHWLDQYYYCIAKIKQCDTTIWTIITITIVLPFSRFIISWFHLSILFTVFISKYLLLYIQIT